MYFADNPNVAQSYATDFSGTRDYPIEGGGRVPGWIGRGILAGRSIDEYINDFQNRLKTSEPHQIGPVSDVLEGLNKVKAGARVQKPSYLYNVTSDIDPEHLLDWDKPLSEQSQHVKDALAQIMKEKSLSGYGAVNYGTANAIRNEYMQKAQGTGEDFIRGLSEGWEGLTDASKGEDASQLLNAHGIPGIKYLDQGSRGVSGGSHNYVIFDPSRMRILERK
jgi:hypothetical protein